MSKYFPEPKSSGERLEVELDLSNYATKSDFKNTTGAATSKCAKKIDLSSLKLNVNKFYIDKLKNVPSSLSSLESKKDKFDIGKLETTPIDLSKLSDVVKNDVVKTDLYNDKIKSIEHKISDLTNLAANASLNVKINEVKGEIPNITNLATNASLNAKMNKVKDEIPSITNLTTSAALTAVENKMTNVSNLVKHTDHNAKISEIENKISTNHDHDKYITTQGFYKLTAENFTARLKQANLASKNDIANFTKKTDFDNKLKDVTSNENESNELSKNVKAISTEGLAKDLINKFSILNGAKYFSLFIFQNCLVFIPAKKKVKYFSGFTWIDSWKSNGFSEENIENITKSDSNFSLTFVDHHALPDINLMDTV